jgi:hypothetical protein
MPRLEEAIVEHLGTHKGRAPWPQYEDDAVARSPVVQLAMARQLVHLAQEIDGLTRKQHAVRLAHLHALRRDVPLRGIEVELGSLRANQQVADRMVVDLLHDHADAQARFVQPVLAKGAKAELARSSSWRLEVNEPCGTPRTENPSRIYDLGSWMELDRTSRDALEPCHIWSIITCPNPEHETCVAPSIRRAKS